MRTLRFAFRTLFRTPFVTSVAIISLAFGIGANSAIFSLFDQMLLRPLPVARPSELVDLSTPGPKSGSTSCNQAGTCDEVFSYPMFRDLEQDNGGAFSSLAAHRSFGANLAYKGETITGDGMFVSGSYFPTLGLAPALGRLLDRNDDQTIGESHVVVLAHNYWQTHFGGNPAVLNEQMVVNGVSMTIVGVAPRGFEGTTVGVRPDVFAPISMRGLLQPPFKGFDNRQSYWIYVFGRLRPGVTAAAAETSANARYHTIITDVEAGLQKGVSASWLEKFRTKRLGVTPNPRGQSSVHTEAKKPLAMLFGVTGVVLLIACANIANLLLARSAARAGEMAVRLSIGAGRGQLIRQLLVESCLLALMGGLAGLIVAKATLTFIASLLPSEATRSLTLDVEPSIAVFAGGLSILTGILFGLFPAIYSTRPDLASTLKGVSGQPSGSKAAVWYRSALVVVQITLSTALLICAGLFAKSLVNVSRVDLGLKTENLVTFSVSPRLNGYTPARSLEYFQRAERDLRALPGVEGVTACLVPVVADDNWGTNVKVQGFKDGPDIDTNASFNRVGPGFFRTMGVPLMSGREFTDADRLGGAKVAIVNQAFVEKFNMGHDVIGRLMNSGDGDKLDTEIVGLVQNAKYSQVKDKVPPVFFLPYMQDEQIGDMSLYVRSSAGLSSAMNDVRRVMASIDPNLPIDGLRTMDDQVKENVFLDRMISTLSAAFAALATLLAAVGLYGVLAYTVTQRTREFGLRMALGASPGRVRSMVIGQVALLTVVGATVGAVIAWFAARALESLLFEMRGHDPWAFTLSIMGLAVIALVAGLLPAMRASRIDPMRALRYE